MSKKPQAVEPAPKNVAESASHKANLNDTVKVVYRVH